MLVVVCGVPAQVQISVMESGTRAELVSGATTITLPIRNSFDKPVQARVSLNWLGPGKYNRAGLG